MRQAGRVVLAAGLAGLLGGCVSGGGAPQTTARPLDSGAVPGAPAAAPDQPKLWGAEAPPR